MRSTYYLIEYIYKKHGIHVYEKWILKTNVSFHKNLIFEIRLFHLLQYCDNSEIFGVNRWLIKIKIILYWIYNNNNNNNKIRISIL
jgi:hypothetical protein